MGWAEVLNGDYEDEVLWEKGILVIELTLYTPNNG